MVGVYGFDNQKQKHLINEIFKVETTTAGKTIIEISSSELGGSISDWFVTAVIYSHITPGTPTSSFNAELPIYSKVASTNKIMVSIDDTKGDNVSILLQKAKTLS